jgi:CheY-like chemotaxis protein
MRILNGIFGRLALELDMECILPDIACNLSQSMLPMKTLIQKKSSAEPVNILLVGNNPIEMGPVLEKLRQVRSRKIITETAFDIQSIVERLVKFHPNFILIDDNIGRDELLQTVNKLSSTRKTKNVPITVLKNSNYKEALASTSIHDYLLKQNLSADTLYSTIKNTLRFRRTQRLLYQAYKNRKGMLMKLLDRKVLNLIG